MIGKADSVCVYVCVDACASMSVYLGQQKEPEEYSAFIIQDPKETFRTIKDIREVLQDLQLKHNATELIDQPGTMYTQTHTSTHLHTHISLHPETL